MDKSLEERVEVLEGMREAILAKIVDKDAKLADVNYLFECACMLLEEAVLIADPYEPLTAHSVYRKNDFRTRVTTFLDSHPDAVKQAGKIVLEQSINAKIQEILHN